MKPLADPIKCKDGFTMSVQASAFHYSQPRQDEGPYTHFEVGFPNRKPSSDLVDYRELPDYDYTESVYPYVPRAIVEAEIAAHGGIEIGKLPE